MLPELVDNPGTTRGSKLSVLLMIVFPSFDPLVGASVVFTVFQPMGLQAFLRVMARLRISLNRERKTCAFSWECTSPLAVKTFANVSDLSELNSFSSPCTLMLLNRRVLAPLVFSPAPPFAHLLSFLRRHVALIPLRVSPSASSSLWSQDLHLLSPFSRHVSLRPHTALALTFPRHVVMEPPTRWLPSPFSLLFAWRGPSDRKVLFPNQNVGVRCGSVTYAYLIFE